MAATRCYLGMIAMEFACVFAVQQHWCLCLVIASTARNGKLLPRSYNLSRVARHPRTSHFSVFRAATERWKLEAFGLRRRGISATSASDFVLFGILLDAQESRVARWVLTNPERRPENTQFSVCWSMRWLGRTVLSSSCGDRSEKSPTLGLLPQSSGECRFRCRITTLPCHDRCTHERNSVLCA